MTTKQIPKDKKCANLNREKAYFFWYNLCISSAQNAVNLGGIGTLISSLVSLITFKEYLKHEPKKGLKYIGLFSLINFAFLGILIVLILFAT